MSHGSHMEEGGWYSPIYGDVQLGRICFFWPFCAEQGI